VTLFGNIQRYVRSPPAERAWARSAAAHSEVTEADSVNHAALGWASLLTGTVLICTAVVLAFALESVFVGAVTRSIPLFIVAFFGALNVLRFAILEYRLKHRIIKGATRAG